MSSHATVQSSPERKLSTRLIRKGALIQETYTIFQAWNLEDSLQENLRRAEKLDPIGAKSSSWLNEVVRTLSSRFSGTDYEPLVVMAQRRVPLDVWKACLLWHIGETDELYFRFATEWLFEEYEEGAFRIRTEHVIPFVREITDGRAGRSGDGSLSEYGAKRAARDLLRMASDFEQLEGSAVREFATYHPPEEGFLYALYALKGRGMGPRGLMKSREWRLFLMRPEGVEREVMRLHQYRRLHYQAAGSLVQLDLPHDSLLEYAQEVPA